MGVSAAQKKGATPPAVFRWRDEALSHANEHGGPGLLVGAADPDGASPGEVRVLDYVPLPDSDPEETTPISATIPPGLHPLALAVPYWWAPQDAVRAASRLKNPALNDGSLILRPTGAGFVPSGVWNQRTMSIDPLAPPRSYAPVALPGRRWLVAAVVGAILFVAALNWYRESRRPTPPSRREAFGQQRLNIDVTRSTDGTLEIRWDPTAADTLRSQYGQLQIKDGGTSTDLALAYVDLKTGKMIYVPRSGNVELMLTFQAPGGPVQERVRIIQPGGGSGPLEVAALPPRPAPAVPTQKAAVRTEPEERRRSEPVMEAPVKPAVVEPKPPAEAPVASVAVRNPPALPQVKPQPEPAVVAPVAPPPEAPKVAEPKKVQPEVPATPTPVAMPEAPKLARTPVPVPPRPIRQVAPSVPPSLKSILPGNVVVSVRVVVGTDGRVLEATSPGGEGVTAHLSRLATAASRQWRFEPATLDGKPVQAEHVIHFRFGR